MSHVETVGVVKDCRPLEEVRYSRRVRDGLGNKTTVVRCLLCFPSSTCHYATELVLPPDGPFPPYPAVAAQSRWEDRFVAAPLWNLRPTSRGRADASAFRWRLAGRPPSSYRHDLPPSDVGRVTVSSWQAGRSRLALGSVSRASPSRRCNLEHPRLGVVYYVRVRVLLHKVVGLYTFTDTGISGV
jgi:hypothetical protein